MRKDEFMLLDWMRKIHQLEYAHCYQSLHYARLEKCIGICAFVLTTIVAFTYRFPIVFYPCVKEYILPMMAFFVAILTGYQTFIKPGEKAETHRKLGLEYEKLRHEAEVLYVSSSNFKPSEVESKVREFKNKWDSLTTLYVNEKYYDEAKQKVKSFNKYPKELSFIPDL